MGIHAQNPSNNPFAASLLSEEGEQDLAAAAAAYREAILNFDRQREGAANAIFRLGEVYRKMGRIEEARVQYARLLGEFVANRVHTMRQRIDALSETWTQLDAADNEKGREHFVLRQRLGVIASLLD